MQRFVSHLHQILAKKWPILLICLAITGLSYAALIHHYFRFSRVVAEVGRQDFLYTIESTIFDWKVNLRGPIKTPSKVGILAVDEKTLKTFGSWPFSRRYYEQAFRNLKALGVKWIGYDVIFADAEVTNIRDIAPSLTVLQAQSDPNAVQAALDEIALARATSPGDRSFLSGMQAFENIVMGYFYFATKREADSNLGQRPRFQGFERMAESAIQGVDMPAGRALEDYLITKAHGLVGNTDFLNQATVHYGFFNNDADDDAINRWLTLVAHIDGQLMPSLALKTVAEYLDREIFVFFNDHGVESLALISRQDESDSIEIPIDANGKGRALINHRGPGRSFYHFSLSDAYANSFSPEEKAALKDSLLLLGGTATGTNDIRPNPFDPSIDGVENHAAMIDNILTNKFYKRPASIFNIERAIILWVGLLFTLVLLGSSAIFSGLSACLFLVGYFYVDRYVWFNQGIWAYMFLPCAQISGMFVAVTIYQYITEEQEKKRVKAAFQHYLSPEVINQVLDHPEHLRLGGQKKELTVFFSDVRGFTTISEALTPEKLCELMNDYFTPMTDIILRSKGVLDKYIGDAIMAFWGAPLTLENSAASACQASIDMLYALDRIRIDFKARGLPDIDIGIGLNTGPMSVGNMGSGDRFTYTVMGDAVNLGSRLEGLTKEYGIKIMISEFTHRMLPPGMFFTRDLDDIRVKGKNEPVNVYELMRPDFLPDADEIRRFIGCFEEGRRYYKLQNWTEAREAFTGCLRLKPEDKASALYIERIEHYLTVSPGSQWDGVYTFKHK